MAIPRHVRFGVLERCNFSCFYCGLPAAFGVVALQIEHVVPQALGGDDDPWNLVAACQPCNLGKTDTMPSDALIRAAGDLYMAWPGRRRSVGRCVDCGRIWILTSDEAEAGESPETMRCWPCVNAWVDGHYADRSWNGWGAR